MPLPRAILFDLDDTLIRAYAQPEEAWRRLLGSFGIRALGWGHLRLACRRRFRGRGFRGGLGLGVGRRGRLLCVSERRQAKRDHG